MVASLLTFPVLQQRPAQQAKERAYVRFPGAFLECALPRDQCALRERCAWRDLIRTDSPNEVNMRSLSWRNMK